MEARAPARPENKKNTTRPNDVRETLQGGKGAPASRSSLLDFLAKSQGQCRQTEQFWDGLRKRINAVSFSSAPLPWRYV